MNFKLRTCLRKFSANDKISIISSEPSPLTLQKQDLTYNEQGCNRALVELTGTVFFVFKKAQRNIPYYCKMALIEHKSNTESFPL